MSNTVLNSQDEIVVLYCFENKDCAEMRRRFYQMQKKFLQVTFGEYNVLINENDLIEVHQVQEIVFFPKLKNVLKSLLGILQVGKWSISSSKEINIIALENEETLFKNETAILQNDFDHEDKNKNEEENDEEEEENAEVE